MGDSQVKGFLEAHAHNAEYGGRSLDTTDSPGVQLSDEAVAAYSELDLMDQSAVAGELTPASNRRLMREVFSPQSSIPAPTQLTFSPLPTASRNYAKELDTQLRMHLDQAGVEPRADGLPEINIERLRKGGVRVESDSGVRGAIVREDPDHFRVSFDYSGETFVLEILERMRGELIFPSGERHTIYLDAFEHWGSATTPLDLYETVQTLHRERSTSPKD